MLVLSRARQRVLRKCAQRCAAVSHGPGRALCGSDPDPVDVAVLRVEGGLASNVCELQELGIIRSQTAREATSVGSNAVGEPRLAISAILSRVIPDSGLASPHPARFHSHAWRSQSADAQATLRGESSEDTCHNNAPQALPPFRSQLRVKTVKGAGNQAVKNAKEQSARGAANGQAEGRAGGRGSVKDHRQQKKSAARQKQAGGDVTAPPTRRSTRGKADSMIELSGAEGGSPNSHAQLRSDASVADTGGSGFTEGDREAPVLPLGANENSMGLGFSDVEDSLLPSSVPSGSSGVSRRLKMSEDDHEEDTEEEEDEEEEEEDEEEEEGAMFPSTVPSLLLRLGASEADVDKMLSRRPRLAQAEAPDLPAVVSLLRSYGVSSAHVLRAAVNCPFWLTCAPSAVQGILDILVDAGEWCMALMMAGLSPHGLWMRVSDACVCDSVMLCTACCYTVCSGNGHSARRHRTTCRQ